MFRSHVLICGGTGCTSSGSQALFTKLESSPYESHGWTAFGFLGITAIATYGEIPGMHHMIH